VRSELVVDALEMARWQRSPDGTIVHADRGVQYTSWVFGHRLSAAGLLGSMGRVASSVDNALIESFWSTMQCGLLDRQHWNTHVELASAIFEWIEGWYNPRRRHSTLGMLSPHEYETLHTAAEKAARSTNRNRPDYRVKLPPADTSEAHPRPTHASPCSARSSTVEQAPSSAIPHHDATDETLPSSPHSSRPNR